MPEDAMDKHLNEVIERHLARTDLIERPDCALYRACKNKDHNLDCKGCPEYVRAPERGLP